MDTIELLDRLIAFRTVSKDSNLDLIAFVREFLNARGIKSEIIPDANGLKANLFATIGPADRSGVILSGHTDVVPVDGQAWTSDPFRLTGRDGRLFGRGTADMKGFLACALRAADNASRRRLATPLHLAFSHDEEVGCIGVRSMLARLAKASVKPRFCLVGEPTFMRIALGHKGKIAAKTTCRGTSGHSALAPKALNAIHLATDFIGRLRQRQEDIAAQGLRDSAYEIPYTTIHVGKIAGGTALNFVPDRAEIEFEIRSLAWDDAAAILKAIKEDAEAIAARHRQHFPAVDISTQVIFDYPALDTAENAEIVDFMRTLTPETDLIKVAFGTEGGLFQSHLGIPTLICGPGSIEQAHKPDEFIEPAQLEACDAMLDRLIERLAA